MKKKISKCKQYYKQGILIKMVKRKIVNVFRPFLIIIMKVFPINSRKICFDSFEGTGFGGDPKYICLELIRQRPDIKIIWFVREKKKNFPNNVKQVYIDSVAAVYHQSTAKVWVDNTRTGHRTKKRNGQKYMQTWHGCLLGKKCEKDVEDKLWPEYIPVAKYDGKITDAFIAANQQNLEWAQRAFWLNNNVEYLKIGSPSTDILINKKDDNVFKEKIRNKLKISSDSYVILYAPSFRDDGSTDGYKLDFHKLLEAFEQTTNKSCVMLIRFHPDVRDHDGIFSFTDKMINATRYDDVKDLSLISDCLITDYSSIAYDFLVLRKPIFRICLDFDKYKALRDVYDEFYQLPYGLFLSNDEAIKEIEKFNYEKYQNKLDVYFQRNTIYDNGTASKKAVEWICRQLQ